MYKVSNFSKPSINRFEICPGDPTNDYKPLQVIGFEGAFWFEVFLFEIDFLVYVCASSIGRFNEVFQKVYDLFENIVYTGM